MGRGTQKDTRRHKTRLFMEAHGIRTLKALRKWYKRQLRDAPICSTCGGSGGRPNPEKKGYWLRCSACRGIGQLVIRVKPY